MREVGRMGLFGRLVWVAALAGLAGGLPGPGAWAERPDAVRHGPAVPRTPGTAPGVAPGTAPGLAAVLVAGDGSEVAFDNATDRFRMVLQGGGAAEAGIRQLTSMPAGTRPGLGLATAANVLRAVRAMRPGPGGTCTVFMTSHGVHGQGFWLGLQQEVLTPAALDAALAAGCGAAPTAVVVSACYSGIFAAPPMARANRVILTAARADRSSFGCGAGKMLTDYDRCLLEALGAGTWREVHARVLPCVAANEAGEGFVASEPQAFFGAEVAGLRPDGGR